jgi:lipid A 3-O-deacylase
MRVQRILAVFLMSASAMAATAGRAMAQQSSPGDPAPYGIYVEGGGSLESGSKTAVASAGFTFAFGQRHELWGGALTSYGDIFLSEWRADRLGGGGRRDFTHFGAIATARLRFDQGRSPWFTDLGIGLTYLDPIYETPDRTFSTHFQFTEVLGIGRNFGEGGAHELQLRLQHVSNAGIKEPNPGVSFVRLRYQYHF